MSEKIFLPDSFAEATGALPYTLTNDYMFRAVLQKNNHVLKHLICALLHLQPDQVSSATIENPILLGDAIDTKTYVLDIKVTLDNREVINLEMQVVNEGNWTDRSLLYLCRSFDQTYRGDEYSSVGPATHIGLLNFTLFKDFPEFYAIHKLMNVKNHHIYNDKFTLNVLDLSRIDLATEEDRLWHIDYWASFFKATTWEEIKMAAQNADIFQEAAVTIYEVSADEQIRLQCEARERYYSTMSYFEHRIAEKDAIVAKQSAKLADQSAKLADQSAKLADQSAKLADQSAKLADQDAKLAVQSAKLADQDAILASQSAKIAEQNDKLAYQSHQLANLYAELARLKKQSAEKDN